MTDFHPQQAVKTLRDNSIEIEKLGKQIHQKRLAIIMAYGVLMDAEVVARKKMFAEGIKASFARDFIKLEIAQEEKAHEILKHELKDLESQLHIIEEVNNALKMSYKIANNINF